jgi:hypothetical protein
MSDKTLVKLIKTFLEEKEIYDNMNMTIIDFEIKFTVSEGDEPKKRKYTKKPKQSP